MATTRADVRDKVFLSVQNGLSSSAGRAMVQAGARLAAGSDALAALMRDRQDLVDSIKPLQDQLAVALKHSGVQSEQDATGTKARLDRIKAKILALDGRLSQEFPDFKELINPSAISREELQSYLLPNEALIMTLTDVDNVYVWAISKTQADWHRADIGRASLAQKIKLLRATLSGAPQTRSAEALDQDFVASAAPFDRAMAYDLYHELLGSLQPIFGGASHIMTVVDGPLTSLPFSVFVTRAPTGSDTNGHDLAATNWMIKSYALTTLPSVSSLKILRNRAAKPRIKSEMVPFRGFGDPLLGYRADDAAKDQTGDNRAASSATLHTRGVYDNVSRVADLAPLPNTAKELKSLAHVMGAGDSAIRLGRDATEAAVKSADLSNTSVLAFATHGLLANGLPGLDEPALVFTPPNEPSDTDDALLTASEAAQLKLSADLIILSACNTAGSDGTPGADGLSGLARSFIYAGARAILVSHWPVDDYAASVLTTGMLKRMYGTNPVSRAVALQASMLDLMNDPKNPAHANPRFWAPFVVVGEGGKD